MSILTSKASTIRIEGVEQRLQPLELPGAIPA